MTTQKVGRSTAGAILITVGLVLFAFQFMQGLGPELLFFSLSAAFLAGYLWTRSYGLLIPGGILLGVGLSVLGSESRSVLGDLGVIGLGIGFILIYLVARLVEGRSHWWPLIPGAALILPGVAAGSELLDVYFCPPFVIGNVRSPLDGLGIDKQQPVGIWERMAQLMQRLA